MKRDRNGSRHISILAIFVALSLAAACRDSDTLTGPPASPAPAASIAGAWTGTYFINDAELEGCSSELPAGATFEQDGTRVVGRLNARGGCGLDYAFEGTLQGNRLEGTLSNSENPGFTGSASGFLSGATLTISAQNMYRYQMGLMSLHR